LPSIKPIIIRPIRTVTDGRTERIRLQIRA
jgi:hypothetical protein